MIVDYSYTYNQSDYATWYLQEGDNFSSQQRKEIMDFWKREGLQGAIRRAETDLVIYDMWASAWVERHPEHVDEQLFQKIKKARDELVPGAQ